MKIQIHPALAFAASPITDLATVLPTVVVADPGNGTRYTILVTPITDPDALRDLGASDGSVVVSLWPHSRNSASAIFRRRAGYLAPQYVAEKLRVGDADAEALAAIIGELLDRPNPATPVREVRS